MEEPRGRSPLPDYWQGDGLVTDSAYISSDDSQHPWPGPPRNTPGSRAREEELRNYQIVTNAIDFPEQWWCDTNQRGEPDQSFFVAWTALP